MNDDTADLADLRVLIVDDNVDAATSLSYLLQMIGCKTAVAFGGERGVRVAELFQPALLILDLDMPGMDGCEVLRRVKRLPGPVGQAMAVCLTGSARPDDGERCLGAGFDLFVAKPVEPQALSDMLLAARTRRSQGWHAGLHTAPAR